MPQRASAKKPPHDVQTPRLVFQPEAFTGIQKGINVIAEAVRPTLGPLPRLVAVDPIPRGNHAPELLDNGALIARRIFELSNRDADMGAMLLRQLLWRQQEMAGDGTATAAVLFQSVYNEGVRFIAAGGDPMRLRHCLERGMRLILDQLGKMAVPLDGQAQITEFALSTCHDAPLSEALGEVFDVIGKHGLLEIRSGRSREVEQEYIEGAFYKGGASSQALIANSERSVEITDAAVFISDMDLDDPQHLVHLIALAFAAGKKTLVVLAKQLSEKVVGLLASVSQTPERFRVIAVKAPDDSRGQAAMLDDLAVLTGGRVFLRDIGDKVTAAKVDDLGAARRVWANEEYFGIVGGKGSSLALRQHVTALEKAFDRTEDLAMRKKLRERIGKLMGGAAVLRVGGSTDLEIKVRKETAERASDAVRSALMQGVLPGGGAALLACRSTLMRMADRADDWDERMAYRILSRGLEEPTRAIAENAGYESAPIIAGIAGSGDGFDARCGKIVDMTDAGIIDSAGVVITAVREAIASAALALTVDVLVHHRKPEISANP